MRFFVSRSSDPFNVRRSPTGSVEFNTLDELLKWIAEQGESVIISGSADHWLIEIYDEFRE